MTPDDINHFLQTQFGDRYEQPSADSWQVETDDYRLLLLSADGSWLRALIPITPAADALPFLSQILESNFDLTQETRYALYEDLLWGVFQHDLATLQPAQLEAAMAQLLKLKQDGVEVFFNQMIEVQLRKIIAAAKLQGQSLKATMQTLDRF